ncbi:MAG: InlB B-repeat-containing protein, partial [Defluviitaleaceae bacterium]|nr:InlB B-repeat-containing protein [Defluviitaleaceae bacterium]
MKRIISVFIAVLMVLGLVPIAPPVLVRANTVHNIQTGNVTITASGDHTINGTGTATTNRIVVNSGVTANITLNNVNVDVNATTNAIAFDMAGATVNLTLEGANTLRSGNNRAGIHAPSGSTLTIDGTGELTARGGTSAAGIGGESETTFTRYTVTFNNNYTGAPANATRQTNADGKISDMPQPAARSGFVFNGWWSAASGGTRMQLNRVYTANTTVHAQWIAQASGRFILTFDGNGGTVMQSTAQTGTNSRLAAADFPTVPIRAGHVFVGWYRTPTSTRREDMLRENVDHNANTTYFARWRAMQIRYNLNGGALPSGNTANPRNLNANGTAPLPTPTRSGHTFAGWWSAQIGGTQISETTIFNGSSTIFARWTPNSGTTYTVTFNVNGGTALSPNTRATGTNLRLTEANIPAPTRSGHTFLGWFDRNTGKQITTSTVFSANTEVHANWMVNEPNASGSRLITLNPNGGTVTNTSRRTDAHGFLMLPLPTPVRDDFVFTGWYTAATGGTRVLSGAYGHNFSSDATIFARWSPLVQRNVNNTPANFRENFDWFKDSRHVHEPVLFGRNNLIFDQIWAGNGTLNFAIRWDSNVVMSFEDRRLIQNLLHEEVNRWTRPLMGFEDWPFGEIQVTVVGWAVRNINVIQDRRPSERVWVNNVRRAPFGASEIPGNSGDLQPSLPDNMSRFVNFSGANAGTFTYPSGLHNRFDMYLWGTSNSSGTSGIGGGAGGDWGTRMGCTQTRNAARLNPPGAMVLSHEIGHGFGKYDFYGIIGIDRPYPTADGTLFNSGTATTTGLRSVMVVGGGTNVPSVYDEWNIRYYWNWVRQDGAANRFRTSLQPMGTELISPNSGELISGFDANPLTVSEPAINIFDEYEGFEGGEIADGFDPYEGIEIPPHDTTMHDPEKNNESQNIFDENFSNENFSNENFEKNIYENFYDDDLEISAFNTPTGGNIRINGGRVTARAGSTSHPAIGGTVTASGQWNIYSSTTVTVPTAITSTGAFTNNADFSAVRLDRIFAVSVSANPSAGGTVTGGGNIAVGSNATVVATANAGYDFDGWFEGATLVSNNRTYTFAVTGNRSLTARFSSSTGEAVLYDMQTTTRIPEDGFAAFAGAAGMSTALRSDFAPLDRTGVDATIFSATTSPTRTISVTGRSGVAHAVRLIIGGTEGLGGSGSGAIATSAGNTYRLEYTAVFAAGGTPRIRFEGATGNVVPVAQIPGGTQDGNHVRVDGAAVAAGVEFTHGINLTQAQLAAIGSRNVSLSAAEANINITYRNVRIIRNPVVQAPTPAISISPATNHIFASATEVHTVSVNNASTVATGALTVALSGANASSFTLSRTTIPSIANGAAAQTFTVTPRADLAAGVHRATVTVSGTGITSRSFNVEINISVEEIFSIEISPSQNFNFGAANVGYTNISPHEVAISNTGNVATGALEVRLSGANANNFELSRNSVPSIAVGASQNFTVRPRASLAPGAHTATVTVRSTAAGTQITDRHNSATVSTSGTPIWENHTLVNSATVPMSGGAPNSRPAAGNSWGTWDLQRNGSSEARSAFLQYTWAAPVRMNRAEILWYDDGVGTRIPTATTWAIQYSADGTTWQNVTLTGATNYNNGRALNAFNIFEFEEINARYLRVHIWGITASALGTGVVRWRVQQVTEDASALQSRSFNVEFFVRSWSLALEPATMHTFPTADFGYDVPGTHTVTIRNTGNQPTGALRASLSGADVSAFWFAQTEIESIATGSSAELTVLPMTGLAAGTYNATVTVAADAQASSVAVHSSPAPEITTSGTPIWENHNEVRGATIPASSRPGAGNGWGTWNLDNNGSTPARTAFLQYAWTAFPVSMNRAEIYWYDDGVGTRIPAANSFAIQFSNDGTTWTNVTLTGDTNYSNGRELNSFNRFEFEEINARFLRVSIWGITASAAGTGILRFHVFHDPPPADIAAQSFNVRFTVNPPREYVTVTFVGEGESLPVTIPRGSSVDAPPVFTRSGYIHHGWTGGDFRNVSESTTLNA